MSEQVKKLHPMDFITRAVTKLRSTQSKGIHVVISGFNTAWAAHYGAPASTSKDGAIVYHPEIQKLVEANKIIFRPCRKGAMLYLASDAPAARPSALDTILS